MKKILWSMILFCLVGCPGVLSPDVRNVKMGVLKTHINQSAFAYVWGYPEKMKSITSTSDDKTFSAVWNRFGGSAYEGKRTSILQVWEYNNYGVTLFFDDDNELVYWQTDKTVSELKAISDSKK